MDSKLLSFIILLSAPHFNGYVYDQKYPIVLTTNQVLPETKEGVTLTTDHFGYSLDLAKYSNSKPSLWVGAPKGVASRNRRDISGALHTCNIDAQNPRCDPRPEIFGSNNEDFYDQLFGITVNTVKSELQGSTEVWSCATNFKRPYDDPSTNIYKTYAMMLGHCYAYNAERSPSSSSNNPRRVIPLDDENTQHSYWKHKYGRDNWTSSEDLTKLGFNYGNVFAELGSSLHYDVKGNKLLFGAPGTWNWTGTTIITDVKGTNPVRTQPMTIDQPWMYDYTGYALTSGDFGYFNQVTNRQYAIGSPRGAKSRTGKVYIAEYDDGSQQLNYLQTLTPNGAQSFEYFGASLAALDMNGDGVDELIVGSPLFSNSRSMQQSTSSSNYEEGRISIYTRRVRTRGTMENSGIGQDSLRYFLQFVGSIFGDRVGGRFGSAIASVGDLDGDGKDDLVVGSPYENDGKGAVRVFYGKSDLTRLNDDLQTITTSQLGCSNSFACPANLLGFGISFSSYPHVDVDYNGLEDLAVGSHMSRNAVVLRRRPSVWVELKINSNEDSINISDLKAFQLEICTTMHSTNFNNNPQNRKTSTLDATIKLSDDGSKRTYFIAQDGSKQQSITQNVKSLVPDIEQCKLRIDVQFREDFIRDSDPSQPSLVFEVNLKATDQGSQTQGFNGQLGVLDPRRAPRQTETKVIPFRSGCDGMCSIDLSISAKANDVPTTGFVIGSKEKLIVIFTVTNSGKDVAFLPVVKIPVIPNLPYRQLGVGTCEVLDIQTGMMDCPIGRPLKPKQSYDISIEYDTRKIPARTPTLFWRNIYVQSNSQGSTDTDRTNDRTNLEVPLVIEADLQITGDAVQKTLPYIQNERFLNKTFEHSYQVSKSLSTPITGVSLEVHVPMYYQSTKFSRITDIKPLSSGCTITEPNIPPDTTEKIFPQNVKCTIPGVKCATIRCPPFDLPKNNVAVKLQIKIEFMSSVVTKFQELGYPIGTEDDDKISLNEGDVRIISEATVKFPKEIEDIIAPSLDKLPNTAFCGTTFVAGQVRVAFVWWQIIVAIIAALLLLLFFIIALVYCNCFQRKPRAEADDGINDLLQQGAVYQGEDDTFLSAKSNMTD